MAKDFRRMLNGKKVNWPLLESMENFLKDAYDNDYESVRERILDAKSII